MSIKHTLKTALYHLGLGRVLHPARSRDELRQYWRSPDDDPNRAAAYIDGRERSEYLISLVKQYGPPQASILEIGCNVGRNLHFLHAAGYRNLTGIEISEAAVNLMGQTFPDVADTAVIHNALVEDVLPALPDQQFDVTFSMAVLEHIPTESEAIFNEIARVTRHTLITIEDEHEYSWRHFPRNYKWIFEAQGFTQVYERSGLEILPGPGFVARVFNH